MFTRPGKSAWSLQRMEHVWKHQIGEAPCPGLFCAENSWESWSVQKFAEIHWHHSSLRKKQQTKQEKHTCCRHNQLHNLIFFNILWIISQYNSQELLILWLPLQLNCMQQTEIYSRLSLGLSEMFFSGGKTQILKMIHLWTEGYIESFSDNTPWICFWLVVRFNHLEKWWSESQWEGLNLIPYMKWNIIQSCFDYNIWDNPSHWLILSHMEKIYMIFPVMFQTTNHMHLFWFWVPQDQWDGHGSVAKKWGILPSHLPSNSGSSVEKSPWIRINRIFHWNLPSFFITIWLWHSHFAMAFRWP